MEHPATEHPVPRQVGIKDLPLLYRQFRPEVYRICRRLLTTAEDAEDATQAVFEKLIRRLPQGPIRNPGAYLAEAARSAAADVLRKKQRALQSTSLTPDMVDQIASEEVVDRAAPVAAQRLVAEARPFLNDHQDEVLDVYLRLRAGEISTRQAADELGVKPKSLPTTLRRLEGDVEKAIAAAVLVTQPTTCAELAHLTAGTAPSSLLRKRVDRHVMCCETCQDHKSAALSDAAKVLHSVAPLGMFGFGSFTVNKVAAATALLFTGGAVAGVLVFSGAPATDAAPPPVPATTPVTLVQQPVATGPSASTSAPVPPSAPSPVAPPPVIVQASPELPAPSAVMVAPPPQVVSQTPQVRSVEAPTITAGPNAIEHRQIATKKSKCPDRVPVKSRVQVVVTAPDGVESVRLSLSIPGMAATLPMAGVGSTWVSQIGPLPEEAAGRTVEVAVLAVGRNGQRAEKSLGTVQIVDCTR